MKRRAVDIVWDTDGEQVDLPQEINIPDNVHEEDISDYLSDITGWCHAGYRIVEGG